MIKDINRVVIVASVRIGLIVVGTVLLNYFLQNIIATNLRKKIKIRGGRRERVETLITIFNGTLKFIISILALLMILSELGVNITVFLTGISVFGLAIGLAAQSIATDFISGIFIIIEDQYMIGSKVRIAGVEGVVKEMSLRRTVIEDSQGAIHSIPNGQIKSVTKL